jgi:hypothetical protein
MTGTGQVSESRLGGQMLDGRVLISQNSCQDAPGPARKRGKEKPTEVHT